MFSLSTVTIQFRQLKISLHVTEQAGVVCHIVVVSSVLANMLFV